MPRLASQPQPDQNATRTAASPQAVGRRITRQAVHGRSSANYDMKLHPMDEFNRQRHWARRHGQELPPEDARARRRADKDTSSEDEESLHLSSGEESVSEMQLDSDDTPSIRTPDPRATRSSQRTAARQFHDYRANVHPNDDKIPGFRRKKHAGQNRTRRPSLSSSSKSPSTTRTTPAARSTNTWSRALARGSPMLRQKPSAKPAVLITSDGISGPDSDHDSGLCDMEDPPVAEDSDMASDPALVPQEENETMQHGSAFTDAIGDLTNGMLGSPDSQSGITEFHSLASYTAEHESSSATASPMDSPTLHRKRGWCDDDAPPRSGRVFHRVEIPAVCPKEFDLAD